MIKMDPIVLEFIQYNFITVGLVLGFLKGLAKLTRTTTDDKIVTLLSNMASSAKSKVRR